MLKALVEVWLPESATCTVKFAVPAVVGVPVMAPVLDSDSPAGKLPVLMDQV